jgi:hypothetical protein
MNAVWFRFGAAAVLLASAGTAGAQQWRDVRASGRYGAFGVGTGSLTIECDSGCPGGRLSANDIDFTLGRQFGARLRFELGARLQMNNDAFTSRATVGHVGMAAYLVKDLFVRAAGTWVMLDAEDSVGTTAGNGGPGFMAGAGYELFVGRTTALTAYANVHRATVSGLDRTIGSATARSGGDVSGVNFGVSIGRSPRRAVCVDADGRRTGTAACLDAARSRLYAGVNRGHVQLQLLGLSLIPPGGTIAWHATTATPSGGTALDQLVGRGPGGQTFINVSRSENSTCAQFMAEILLRSGSRMVSSPPYVPAGGWYSVVIEQGTNSAFMCLPLRSGILVAGAVTADLAATGVEAVRPMLFALGQAAQQRWGRGTN